MKNFSENNFKKCPAQSVYCGEKKFNSCVEKLLCENRIIYHAYPLAN